MTQPTKEQLEAYFPLSMMLFQADINIKNQESLDDNMFSRRLEEWFATNQIPVQVSWGDTNGMLETEDQSYFLRLTTHEHVSLMAITEQQSVTFILREE